MRRRTNPPSRIGAQQPMTGHNTTRRNVLKGLGATAILGLAGCTGSNDDASGNTTTTTRTTTVTPTTSTTQWRETVTESTTTRTKTPIETTTETPQNVTPTENSDYIEYERRTKPLSAAAYTDDDEAMMAHAGELLEDWLEFYNYEVGQTILIRKGPADLTTDQAPFYIEGRTDSGPVYGTVGYVELTDNMQPFDGYSLWGDGFEDEAGLLDLYGAIFSYMVTPVLTVYEYENDSSKSFVRHVFSFHDPQTGQTAQTYLDQQQTSEAMSIINNATSPKDVPERLYDLSMEGFRPPS